MGEQKGSRKLNQQGKQLCKAKTRLPVQSLKRRTGNGAAVGASEKTREGLKRAGKEQGLTLYIYGKGCDKNRSQFPYILVYVLTIYYFKSWKLILESCPC